MKSAVLALAFALSTALLAQPQTAPGAPAEGASTSGAGAPATCVIEGAVVKSTTSMPLKRALVTAQRVGGPVIASFTGDAQRVAHTDAVGHFVLRDLSAGEYSIWVNRDGYLGLGYGQETPTSPGKTLSLAPGEARRDLLFRLIPTGAIVGRVYDEDGEPVSGVNVQALRYAYFNGTRQLNQVGGASTNDLGEYRLTGLAADKYFVSAIYANSGGGDDSTPEAYAPLYYPGTIDPGGATTVEVRAGDETPIDFSLIAVPAVRVRGRILNPEASKPGVGLNLSLFRRQSSWSFVQAQVLINTSQGTFEIRDVPPGSYYLVGQMWDHRKQYYARLPIDVGESDLNDLGLTLGPGLDLTGRLRVEGQSQLRFNTGSGEVNLTGLQVSLQPRDQMPFGVQPTVLSSDGSFTLKNVPSGNYQVVVCCLPENLYLKAAHLGGDDGLEQGITIDQGNPPSGGFDLVISTAGGHIDGKVASDQKPAGAATVVLVPDANRRDQTRLYSVTPTDPQGSFSINSITPGDYTLFAWRRIEDGVYFDPDFLRSYEGRGKEVRIDEGGKLRVELELITADDVK